MPRATGVLAVTLLLLLNVACGVTDSSDPKGNIPWRSTISLDATQDSLWASTVSQYLKQPLWQARDAYDAGHVLMLPLEAAFRSTDETKQQEFAAHYARFTEAFTHAPGQVVSEPLDFLQYLYTASRFLALSSTTGHQELIPRDLPGLISKQLAYFWRDYPAWEWDRDPFLGMSERLDWKLSQHSSTPSYYRAVIDEEMFLLAIAADYRVFENATGVDEKGQSVDVNEMLDTAYDVVRAQGEATENGGWLFQVGVWADHPDFAYAGHNKQTRRMKPQPRPGVTTDSSHSSRWPLWLRSFVEASRQGSLEGRAFVSALDGLSQQFATAVLRVATPETPYLRMTNYMDGWNGLYRWGYETLNGSGYQAYELSGTLVVGWWGALPDERVTNAYCDEAEAFPLPQQAVEVYVGPNTTRERNPLVKEPTYLTNGFAELEVRLACALGRANT